MNKFLYGQVYVNVLLKCLIIPKIGVVIVHQSPINMMLCIRTIPLRRSQQEASNDDWM